MKRRFAFAAGAGVVVLCAAGVAGSYALRSPARPQPKSGPTIATIPAVATKPVARGRQKSARGRHCPLPIPNGQVLQQNWGVLRVEHANVLKIENRSAQNAIIKLRDPMLGRTRLALFVERGKDATYDDLPEGKYIVDYALGQDLDTTCMTFAPLAHAAQIGYFGFMAADNADGSRYRVQELAIPATPDPGADTNAIDEDTFNFD